MAEHTVGGRVRELMNRRFVGRQTRMADATAVAQPVISRVLADKQLPPFKLLVAIAKMLPDLDLRWLLTGEGDPFADKSTESDHVIPIYDTLLPGNTAEPSGTVRVAREVFRTSRFAYILRQGDPAIVEGQSLLPGDVVVFDRNSDYWRDDLQRLRGHLCVVDVLTSDGRNGLLARANCTVSNRSINWYAHVYGLGTSALLFEAAYRPYTYPHTQPTGRNQCQVHNDWCALVGPEHSSIVVGSSAPTDMQRPRPSAAEPVAHLFAVAVCLLRHFDRAWNVCTNHNIPADPPRGG